MMMMMMNIISRDYCTYLAYLFIVKALIYETAENEMKINDLVMRGRRFLKRENTTTFFIFKNKKKCIEKKAQ